MQVRNVLEVRAIVAEVMAMRRAPYQGPVSGIVVPVRRVISPRYALSAHLPSKSGR